MDIVGEYPIKFNEILGISLPTGKIFVSDGLGVHIKKHHPGYEKYISMLSEIIQEPDYIGINPKEPDSVELVKRLSENIQVAIKLDTSRGYLYVASIYDVHERKVQARLKSGRLKIFA